MARCPSFEASLLEVHQSLQLDAYPTLIKRKFSDLGLSGANHQQKLEEVLDGIFRALDLDPQACRDARSNLVEWAEFHRARELQTWTGGADLRQVAWMLLTYAYVPGMARRIAFWNLPHQLDQGMPGGEFWFLPRIDSEAGEVRLPVPQVLGWLFDLLQQSEVELAHALAAHDEDPEERGKGIRKDFANWRRGRIPSADTIKKCFPDTVSLQFRGVFELPEGASTEDAVAAAKQFVAARRFTAASLRSELPIGQEQIHAVLNGHADASEQERFVTRLARRYARPDMRTIRRRLLIARMVQDGYRRLVKFLCPGVDEDCTDLKDNKVLQLIRQFELIYNLTVAAWKEADSERAQDAWFEAHLPPPSALDLYLSICPSMRSIAIGEWARTLSRRFVELESVPELEDIPLPGLPNLANVLRHHVLRLERERQEDARQEELLIQMRLRSPRRLLAQEDSYWVVSQIAQGELSPAGKSLAVARLRELAKTPGQVRPALLIELGALLNARRAERPKDVQARVERLLAEFEACGSGPDWKAPFLQYRAKHLLAAGDAQGAIGCFRQALEAASEDSFGQLRGEIARDLLATEVALQGYVPENHGKLLRIMEAYGMFGWFRARPEDTTRWASDYFHQDLHKPYRRAA